LLIHLWYESWHTTEQPRQRWLLLSGAVLMGLLPFAHVHTFFVAAGVLAWLTFIQTVRQRRVLTPWIESFFLAVLVAGPQVEWQLTGNFTDDFSRWYFGWMKNPDESLIVFWLRNMGLGIVFMFANFLLFKPRRWLQSFHLHFYFPLIALFIITNLYLFQPHNYDNMKFMVYSYLAVAMFTAHILARWLKHSTPLAVLAIACFTSLTLVGMLSIARETYASWQFSASEEIELAQRVKEVVPAEARILTSDQHNHFVPTLTGRRVVMGFRAWLWTYGLDYHQVEQDVAAIFAGAPSAPNLLQKYGVSYVIIGPSERTIFSANQVYFDTHYPIIITTKHYRIYQVN